MGQFIKQTIASVIGTIAGFLLLVGAGTTAFVLFFMTVTSTTKVESVVKDKSILVFDLSTPIRDASRPVSIRKTLAGEVDNSLSLRDVLQSLEKAGKDDRIVGVLLDGRKGGAGSGYAVLTEVREAIAKLQAQGKKIIAYDVNWSEKEYYLASVADEVILNPMGMMEFNGFSSQQTFYKGALQKYGVGVQIVRVGDFKSAVEPYTRENLSPANRQQTGKLLGDLWQKFLVTVGEDRELEPKILQQVADREGFLEPKKAKEAGLIDQVNYFDMVSGKLRELTSEPAKKTASFRKVNLRNYNRDRKVKAPDTNVVKNQVAVIYAEGSIVGGKGGNEQIGGDRFAKEFRELRKDKNVKAIVLRVNSPGGSATASEIILRELLLTKKEKPVIVSMGNIAASGGYWISAGADYIFAEENTITGSIGVFGLLPNIKAIGNNHGVTWDSVQTGKFADIGSNVRPKTDAELAIFQRSISQTYNLFLSKVARYRKMPKTKVAKIAQGRVWSGQDALKIGLVDQIGGLNNAIAHAAEKAELGENWQVREYPNNQSWEADVVKRLLKAEIFQVEEANDPLTLEIQKLKQDFQVFKSFNDPLDIYAHSAFNLDIE